MFAQVHCPSSLSGDDLDRYLEQGWFRMGQTIFTTNFLNFKSHLYSAIWLRVDLNRFVSDKADQKLLRLNQGFATEIRRLSLDQQKDQLYAAYKDSISFE